MNSPFVILPTDRYFFDSPEAGEPGCICSRCLLQIREEDCCIRAWSDDGTLEWRYHPQCIGATLVV